MIWFQTLQTKGCRYNNIDRCWRQDLSSLHKVVYKGFEFNTLILYCFNKDGKTIERIYTIPKKECLDRTTIGIYKNPTNNFGRPIIPWYEQYRISDEDIIKKVNNIWKKIGQ